MAFQKAGGEGGFRRKGNFHRRKKVCVFCGSEAGEIDYKDAAKLLFQVISECCERKIAVRTV